MGFLADKTVFSPLTKEILEESISFSCGNDTWMPVSVQQ